VTSAIRADTTTAFAGRAGRAGTTTSKTAARDERCGKNGDAPDADAHLIGLSRRVRGEYAEMPGLRLTVPQAARLFSLAPDVAELVLDGLREDAVLHLSPEGTYSLRR